MIVHNQIFHQQLRDSKFDIRHWKYCCAKDCQSYPNCNKSTFKIDFFLTNDFQKTIFQKNFVNSFLKNPKKLKMF